MKRLLHWLALALPLLSSSMSAVTTSQTFFEHLTIEDGLSQSTINCILQDSKGFMLFGTQFGLNRYDGLKFTVNKPHPHHPDRISANEIYALLEDRNDVLWIGTRNGLNKYNKEKDNYSHFVKDANDPHTLSSNVILSMSEDRRGYLWIATEEGLNRFDPRVSRIARYMHDPENPGSISNNYISYVMVDSLDNVWACTDAGLNKLEPRGGKFVTYRHNPLDKNSLSSDTVLSVYEDKAGTIWVGTKGGLNKLNAKTGTFTVYRSNPEDPFAISNDSVSTIFEDSNGSFWVGTANGLNKFDRSHETFIVFKNDAAEPSSISANYITAMFEDHSGILWIGTYSGGVNKFLLKKKPFNHIHITHPESDPNRSNDIWAVRESQDGTLWIGTDGAGLFSYNRMNGLFSNYRHQKNKSDSLSHDIVYSVFEDSQNTLWAGTEKGLNRFDRKSRTFRRLNSNPGIPGTLSHDCVLVIMEDKSGQLWLGTWGGLNKYDREKDSFISYRHDRTDRKSLSNNIVYSLHEDRQGQLWVGTFKGLNRFDQKTGHFTRYRHKMSDPSSISHDGISVIYEDTAGNFWIGTDCGLNLFDPATETFTHFCEEEGLPNDVIYGIQEDGQGFLWISTNNGISKFDPVTRTFKNYTIKDGLQDFEFNMGAYSRSRNGEMFFGGINGLNAFYPDFIKDNIHIPPIAITGFQLFNQPVPIGKTIYGHTILQKSITETENIKLRYNQNNFTFEFAALDYVYPQKNRYAFKMEGFEKEWNTVGSRNFANYINLPPGEYRFRVIGSNNDSVWNNQGAAIGIIITPPFWNTYWFKISVILLSLILTLVFYKLKTKQIKKRNRELVEINTRLNQQISVRKKAEDELKRSQSQLRALSNHLESAREKERVRIAREIHDELGQAMTALKMDIAWVKKKIPEEKLQIPQKLEIMLKQTDNVIQTVKRISSDLRPGLLDHLGLAPAIQWEVEKFNKHTEIACQLFLEPDEIHLGDHISTAVFRIFQEALTNIRRHAGATQVNISLMLKENILELCVSDNGLGISDDQLQAPQSFGIIGMQERVRHLGGTLSIAGRQNSGTTLMVTIPTDIEESKDD